MLGRLSGGRKESCSSEPSGLPPLRSQAQHGKPVRRLRRRLRTGALRTGLLDSVQRVGDDPVADCGGGELIRRREMASLGLAADATSEDEALVVVAWCAHRSLIVPTR